MRAAHCLWLAINVISHAHTNTRTHARTRAHTHARTHARTHAHTHTTNAPQTQRCICTREHKRAHQDTHTYSCTHSQPGISDERSNDLKTSENNPCCWYFVCCRWSKLLYLPQRILVLFRGTLLFLCYSVFARLEAETRLVSE